MRINFYLVVFTFLLCGSVTLAQQRAAEHNLLPVPASVTFDNERLAIDQTFKVALRGHSDARLQAAVERFVKPKLSGAVQNFVGLMRRVRFV